MNKYKAVFISDVHLGTKGCKAKRLLKFLKSFETENLYLVGDIIDGWALQRNHFWSIDQTEIIRRILKISEKSTVTYIAGNHDEFVRPFFKYDFSFGNLHIVDSCTYTSVSGKNIFVVHGDRWDWIRYIPTWFINFLGKFTDWAEVSEESSSTIKRVARTSMTEKLIKKHIKGKYDAVICGHTHFPKMEDSYMNCGDWKKNCTAIVEHLDGTFELVYYP